MPRPKKLPDAEVLARAWDALEDRTAAAVATAPRSPGGAIELLTSLSRDRWSPTCGTSRSPALQARAAAWSATLVQALDACFVSTPGATSGIGRTLVLQWLGALSWWSLDPQGELEDFVETRLSELVRAVVDRAEAS